MQNNISPLDRLFSGEIEFIFGANKAGDLPPEKLPEIAFVGKSNVGKSSLINSFTGRKQLARVSHTPGRTRQLNFFKVQDVFCLVDLPGYGYAKVSKTEHENWEKMIVHYLRTRKSLKLVILLVDARHGFKDHDIAVMKLLEDFSISYWIVFTKSDKIGKKDVEILTESAKKLNDDKYCLVLFTNNRSKEGVKTFKDCFWKYLGSKSFSEKIPK